MQQNARDRAAMEQNKLEAFYRNDPISQNNAVQRVRLEAQWRAASQQQYSGAGSAANLYAQAAQAEPNLVPYYGANYNGPGSAANLYAQQAAAAFAPPVYYNGAGSAGNLYAAAARENDMNASKYSALRRQQAAYHATLGQNTMDASKYYFGPGSMEQEYATRAYANAPIGIPTVPVDNTYYGGGYGGYGGGGGGGYVAPEADIPRWLYGMLNWRYR